jgi:hypothetical protein
MFTFTIPQSLPVGLKKQDTFHHYHHIVILPSRLHNMPTKMKHTDNLNLPIIYLFNNR